MAVSSEQVNVRCWLIRHGKAEGARPDDLARPLAKRGRSDAASMRAWMLAQHPNDVPQLWVASPARRTRETAELLAGGDVALEPRLYGAWTGEFFAVMAATPLAIRSAAFVGHNPTVGSLFHALSGRAGAPLPDAGHRPVRTAARLEAPRTGTLARLQVAEIAAARGVGPAAQANRGCLKGRPRRVEPLQCRHPQTGGGTRWDHFKDFASSS